MMKRLACAAMIAAMAMGGAAAKAATLDFSGATFSSRSVVKLSNATISTKDSSHYVAINGININFGSSGEFCFFSNNSCSSTGTIKFTNRVKKLKFYQIANSVGTRVDIRAYRGAQSIGRKLIYGKSLVDFSESGAITHLEFYETTRGMGGARWERFSFDYATTTAPVPLPAAGWMMLAGLGGLTALRRKA